jgi:hypothetical protein
MLIRQHTAESCYADETLFLYAKTSGGLSGFVRQKGNFAAFAKKRRAWLGSCGTETCVIEMRKARI